MAVTETFLLSLLFSDPFGGFPFNPFTPSPIDCALPNVSSLVVSSNGLGGFVMAEPIVRFCSTMLPNLDEIDLSNVGALDSDLRVNVAPHCRHGTCQFA
mmetsp:Transcript_6196/g.11299  ORF Transcript_6196/g.11299 Transcript_6196/m.11299 type:complete len:99 (-) Transcript_6196:136-432(-)